MKAVVFALFALVLFQASSVSAQGRLFCDELCGLTDQVIDIPSFAADLWVAADITTTEFSGTKPTGFQLETVGGIRVESGEPVTLNSQGDVTISTPISGIFEVFGANTAITTGDSLTFTANDDVRIDADIITLNTGTNTTGDIVFDSNLSTSFEGVQGIDISSLFRDVDFKAPSGHATFSSDIITFISGDTVDDQRLDLNGDNIEISSDGTFDVNAGTDMRITALENIVFQSRSRDLTLEAFNTLALDGDHVNFESTSFFTATSLVGDLNISAGDTAGFYSHSNVFAASGDVSVSGTVVDAFSTGDVRIGFPPLMNQAAPDVTVTADSIAYGQSGTGSIEFKGIGGVFSLSATDLTTTAESLFIETGEGSGNSVDVSSGSDLSFSSAEELRFDSHQFVADADSSLLIDASDDAFFFARTGSSDSLFSIEASGDLSVAASEDFIVHGDSSISFQGNTITASAVDDIVGQISGISSVQATSASFSAGGQINVLSSFDMDFTAASQMGLTAPQGTAAVEAFVFDGFLEADDFDVDSTDGVITSDNGGFDMHSEVTSVSGGSVSLSAVGNDDQKMSFFAAQFEASADTSLTATAAELEVAAPAADIAFGDQSATVATSFNGGDQYFTSERDDIEFNNVDMSVTGNSGVFFRSDDVLSVLMDNGPVSITTPLLVVSSNGDFTIDADDLILSSDDTVSISAEAVINFSGDSVVLNGNGPGGSVNLIGGESLFSGAEISFDADELSFTSNGPSIINAAQVSLDAEGDTYFRATEEGGSILITAAFEDTIASGAITFNGAGDVSFSSLGLAVSAGFASFSGNNMDISAANLAMIVDDDVTHDTVTSTQFIVDGEVSVLAELGIFITGDSVTFDFDDIQGDNSIVVTGDSTFNACQTLDVIAPVYEVVQSGIYTVAQDPTLCSPPGEFGDFEIIAHSQRTLNLLADSGIDFLGRDSITVQTTGINQAGGIRLAGNAVLPDLADYSAIFNSSTAIQINSQNQEIELRRAQDDRLDAPAGFVNIDALDWIDFQANGFENNFNTQNFGIYLQTQEHPARDSVTWNDADPSVISDIRFRALDGEMQVTAGDLLRLATFQPLPTVPLGRFQNMNIRTTNDILLDAGNGALLVTSQGQTDQDTLDTRDLASISFHANENNISVMAPLAALVFDGHAGLTFESLTSQVPFTAAHGISARTTGIDSNLSYFSEFGTVTVDVQADDIAFQAGADLQEADAGFTASREFILSSGQDQQFRSYGALNSEDQIGVHLVGEDGSITVDSAGDFEFYSAGSTRFDASTGVIDVTMDNDVLLFSNARANFTSQFTSTVTVANGDVVVDANGGGGSVDIVSDSNQSIVGTAAQSIAVTTANDAVYAAKTGITAITNTGDVTVTQRGSNQDTLVHSEGSVLLQADGQTGIRMAGRNVYADAVQDINVDTAAFNIGSTGNTNTATEPLVVIRAGGDADTDGLNINSVGNIDWDTSVASPVLIEANRFNADVGGDMSILANGPIHYNAFGHLDDGLFTLSAEGALDLDGEQSVVVHGEATAFLSTAGSIDFEAIGTDNEDKMELHSSNNFFVSGRNGVGGTFQQTALDMDAEFRDFDLIGGDISMQNTAGNGGHFRFVSDSVIRGDSIGPVTFQATGEINVDTAGERSDIEFNIAGATTVSSSGSVQSSSGSFDLDSPEGVTITANGGQITATASDDITIIANNTLSASSRNTVTIEAGYSQGPTSVLLPQLNITSRGTADFVSVQDFDIEVTGSERSLYVDSDKDLIIQNSIPLRVRDQGDIEFASAGDISAQTGRDFDLAATRDIQMLINDESQLFAGGDFEVTATAANANVLIEAEDGSVILSSSSQTTITAGDSGRVADFTILADSLAWFQNFEEGQVGGIRVASTAPGAVTSISTTAVDVSAEVGVLFESAAGFGLFTAATADFVSTQQGADIVFESRNSDVVVDVLAFNFEDDTAISSDGATVVIEGTGNGSDQVPSVTIGATFQGANDFVEVAIESERDINIRSENRVIFDQSLGGGYTASAMEFTAGSALVLESNGIAPGNNPYGVLLEGDEFVTFDASSTLRLQATGPGGVVSLTGSESVEIDAATFEVFAGDTLNFYSGYTPPLNAALNERIAIEFDGGDVSFRSTHRNININAEDISWSASSDISIRSTGPGSSVTFATANTDADIDARDIDIEASGRFELITGDGIVMDAADDFDVLALDSLTVTAGDDMEIDSPTITMSVQQTLLFLTELGVVDMQPSGFGSGQRFYIPALDLRAGVSDYQYDLTYTPYWDSVADAGYSTTVYGNFINTASYIDMYRHEEENQTPSCENRSFGFDANTHDMCFCQYGKWMCTRNKSEDYIDVFP